MVQPRRATAAGPAICELGVSVTSTGRAGAIWSAAGMPRPSDCVGWTVGPAAINAPSATVHWTDSVPTVRPSSPFSG